LFLSETGHALLIRNHVVLEAGRFGEEKNLPLRRICGKSGDSTGCEEEETG
jgi:hypothetical protein